jgi:hypothetical protein
MTGEKKKRKEQGRRSQDRKGWRIGCLYLLQMEDVKT